MCTNQTRSSVFSTALSSAKPKEHSRTLLLFNQEKKSFKPQQHLFFFRLFHRWCEMVLRKKKKKKVTVGFQFSAVSGGP